MSNTSADPVFDLSRPITVMVYPVDGDWTLDITHGQRAVEFCTVSYTGAVRFSLEPPTYAFDPSHYWTPAAQLEPGTYEHNRITAMYMAAVLTAPQGADTWPLEPDDAAWLKDLVSRCYQTPKEG